VLHQRQFLCSIAASETEAGVSLAYSPDLHLQTVVAALIVYHPGLREIAAHLEVSPKKHSREELKLNPENQI
jgi:hypothetical protein